MNLQLRAPKFVKHIVGFDIAHSLALRVADAGHVSCGESSRFAAGVNLTT